MRPAFNRLGLRSFWIRSRCRWNASSKPGSVGVHSVRRGLVPFFPWSHCSMQLGNRRQAARDGRHERAACFSRGLGYIRASDFPVLVQVKSGLPLCVCVSGWGLGGIIIAVFELRIICSRRWASKGSTVLVVSSICVGFRKVCPACLAAGCRCPHRSPCHADSCLVYWFRFRYDERFSRKARPSRILVLCSFFYGDIKV